MQKLVIVYVGTTTTIEPRRQAFLLVAIYITFAALTFWVSPYRPIEARLSVPYRYVRLLLFPLFLQVPGWLLSQETRDAADAGKHDEWKRDESAWFAQYYQESFVLNDALNMADVSSKLLLGVNVLTGSMRIRGPFLFLYDTVLVTLNLVQLAYSLGPILVRLLSLTTADFPPMETDGRTKDVKAFCGLMKLHPSRFTTLIFDIPFGRPDSMSGRLAVLINGFSPKLYTHTDLMLACRVHNTDVPLAAKRSSWSALRREVYKLDFERAMVKVLARYEIRRQLLQSAIRKHKREIKRHRRTARSAARHAAQIATLQAELPELSAEYAKGKDGLSQLVMEFGNTNLGELKDGSTTQWAVLRRSLAELTGVRAKAELRKADRDKHLTVLSGVLLAAGVLIAGTILARTKPGFFDPASPPPPPPPLYLRMPPPPAAG